jgi:hypothetical protein
MEQAQQSAKLQPPSSREAPGIKPKKPNGCSTGMKSAIVSRGIAQFGD